MVRALFVASSLLCVLVAGCLVDEAQLGLGDIFGETSTETLEDGTLLLAGPVLTGRFEGAKDDPAWTPLPVAAIEQPQIALNKGPAPPTGGGGVEHPLPFAATDLKLGVQFQQAPRLVDYEVRWGLLDSPKADPARAKWSEPRPATEPHSIVVDRAGPYYVTAELLEAGARVGVVQTPLTAIVNTKWTIDSAVFPLRPSGAPEPPNYDEMADRFPFEIPGRNATLRVFSSFRGTWDPTQGTDVDLELDGPDGKPVKCAASAGTGSAIGPLILPDPEQSADLLKANDLDRGNWTLRVGALQDTQGASGSGCSSGYYYQNVSTVPYTVVVELEWPQPKVGIRVGTGDGGP